MAKGFGQGPRANGLGPWPRPLALGLAKEEPLLQEGGPFLHEEGGPSSRRRSPSSRRRSPPSRRTKPLLQEEEVEEEKQGT